MRAYSDNEDLALLSGIDPERVVMITWAIAATLAGNAGVLYGLDKSFKPFTYFHLLLPIFAAAIVGGLGNPLGAIARRLHHRLFRGRDNLRLQEIPRLFPAWRTGRSKGWCNCCPRTTSFAVSFTILVLVLLLRPTGIFWREGHMNPAGRMRAISMFAAMFAALAVVGLVQSWPLALAILNLCLISAVMSLGVNIQLGYAGLFNIGVMGFAALGGVTAVLISVAPVPTAWEAGGAGIVAALGISLATILAAIFTARRTPAGAPRKLVLACIIIFGYFLARAVFYPAVEAIESVDPIKAGFLGGLGLPILLSWIAGGLLAAAVAWAIGKITLGLRADYLAIATLGIAEIIIAVLRNEDWLARGVKNVSGLPRPVPYEVDLQQALWFQDWAAGMGVSPWSFPPSSSNCATRAVRHRSPLGVVALRTGVAFAVGRMMRAIRDNELAASAMGKDVTSRHLQVFVLGSAVVGVAGAMLTTLDGQFTPASYQPLRFTFTIWVMVIVGGSGNNWGAVLGGFVIWFFWVEAEPIGLWLMDLLTSGLAEDNALRRHLLESAAHMRLMTMGVLLLLVLRFSPRGLIPEK